MYSENHSLTADMHTHTSHSVDGKCSPDELCRAAFERGVGVINISDHCDVNRDGELDCFGDSSASVRDALRLKREYAGRMKVLAGIEMGNAHWNPGLAKRCMAIEGIDCVTGSVHRLRYEGELYVTTKADFAHMPPELISGLIRCYFEEIHLMLDITRPDILAHPTYLLRYIVGWHHVSVDIADYSDFVDRILRRVISDGVALEVNTQSVRDRLAGYDIYLLERYFGLGGRLITLGSDAHSTDRIANGFGIAAAELRRIGFKSACYIENRAIKSYKL